MPLGYSAPGFPGQSRTLADLYYNKYRDYDPTTGRYIQADPIGLAGGTNPYSYAMNSPLRYSDPTGEIVPLIIGFLIWFDIDLIEQRLGGSRAWQPWNNEYCIEQDIDFGQAGLAGALGAIPTGYLFRAAGKLNKIGPKLFGKEAGLLNKNPYIRIGQSWKGTKVGGKPVFRISVGSKKTPQIGNLPKFPWHWDLWSH